MHGGGSLTEKLNALLERIMTDLFEETCRQIPIRLPILVVEKISHEPNYSPKK